MPPLPKLMGQGGTGQSCFTVTDLPSFLSPLTRLATPIGKVPQMSHSVSRGLSALTLSQGVLQGRPWSLKRPSQKGQGSKGCVPSQVRNPGLGFPKLGQQRGQVLRKRGAVFPEQSSPGVLPSAPASRAPPPGAPTAENSAGPPGPIVSLRSLCSWAVCFQCPGTALPTISQGMVVPACVLPWAFGRGVGWQGLRDRGVSQCHVAARHTQASDACPGTVSRA